MSNNWSQQPPDKQSNGQNNPPPRTGGLLSNYGRQPVPSNLPVPQTPPGGASHLPVSARPAMPMQAGPTPQQSSVRSGLLSSHRSGIVSNTLQAVRGFSGKMAAIAGHNIQPPAPPLERYRQHEIPEERPLPQKSRPWRRSRTIRIVRKMRNRRERWQHTQPGAARVMQWLAIALGLIIVVVSAGGSAYTYNLYQSSLPQIDRLANQQISQTTRIYDRNMVPLYDEYDKNIDVNNGRRTVVSYSDIPQVMQDAMTSTEDHTFWDNNGFDPLGTARSAIDHSGGGSGITQQVIKNLSHNTDPTVQRKIVEAAEAVGLTQQYPKQKILEMYFNVASFGSQDRGVEAAVEDYFHLAPTCTADFRCTPGITRLDYVSAQDPHDPLMALARASLLAGIPQSPSSFDPTINVTNKANVLIRQDHVLNLMMSFGKSYGPGPITPDVIKKAEKLMADTDFQRYQNNELAPHFVDWIVNQVETALGNGNPDAGVDAFLTGGFNIRTTIDVNLEKYVENAVTRHLTQPELQKFSNGDVGPLNLPLPKGHNVNDAAVVVMNSKTGEILAMNGSSDYYNSTNPEIGGQVNVATQGIGRQPGSSFKPIVYATAFQMGWYPGMVIPDVKTYFPNGEPAGTQIPLTAAQEASPDARIYVPQDYNNTYHPNASPMTVRLATANSFNVPAVKALEFAGIDNVVNTAERMGISALATRQQNHCQGQTLAQCFGVSLVLGTTEVPLLQMVGAYQVFADQGMRVPPQGVLDIWDNYGHNLVHYDPNAVQGTQVLSPEVSYMMTSILQDEHSRSMEFSGDHDLSFWDQAPSLCDQVDYQVCPYQVAAKTGTSSKFIDNLTIGYTPGVVVGVWAGNADNTPMNNVIGITGAAPIWHSVMEFASHGWCNQSNSTLTHPGYYGVTADQVPCTNVDRAKLGISTQNTFTPPADLVQGCVSNFNGLQGCDHKDWMLPNEAPQQTGQPPADNNNGNNGANGSPTPTPTN